MKDRDVDKFTQLVDDLNNGTLTFNMLQIAYRAHIRQTKEIPDNIKDLLCGKSDCDAGIIYTLFKPIPQVIGNMELAYRRGSDK